MRPPLKIGSMIVPTILVAVHRYRPSKRTRTVERLAYKLVDFVGVAFEHKDIACAIPLTEMRRATIPPGPSMWH